MEIVFTRAENACGYERPLDEQLHIVEHRGWEEKKEKEREGRGEKKEREKGKVRARDGERNVDACVTFPL